MADRFVSALLLLVAAIHLIPLVGAVSGAKLEALYGIDVSDPNLELLMRHRAVLFGILGILLGYGAVEPKARLMALCAGSVSVVSFLILAQAVNGYNTEIRSVVMADRVAVGALAAASVLYWLGHR